MKLPDPVLHQRPVLQMAAWRVEASAVLELRTRASHPEADLLMALERPQRGPVCRGFSALGLCSET